MRGYPEEKRMLSAQEEAEDCQTDDCLEHVHAPIAGPDAPL